MTQDKTQKNNQDKADKRAAALRANLKRRKEQARRLDDPEKSTVTPDDNTSSKKD